MAELDKWIQDLLPRPGIDVFRMHHHPYYIFTYGFIQESAGRRSSYYLCHILNECGYEAYVDDERKINNLRTPALTKEIILRHKEEKRRPIAVYPEAIYGNPLDGDIVVRWIMNRVASAYDSFRPSHNDLVYYWSKFYSKSDKNIRLLEIPLIDRSIFNTDGAIDESRTGFCYYAHKYFMHNEKARLPEYMVNNGISLCQDIKRTHNEIAEILKRSKVLYCYEESSITAEAALCGCPTVYIKTDYYDVFDSEVMIIDNVTFFPEDKIDYSFIPGVEESIVLKSIEIDLTRSQGSIGLVIIGKFLKINRNAVILFCI